MKRQTQSEMSKTFHENVPCLKDGLFRKLDYNDFLKTYSLTFLKKTLLRNLETFENILAHS